MGKYEKVGGGTYGVYRKKKTDWKEILGVIAGGIIWVFIIAGLYSVFG